MPSKLMSTQMCKKFLNMKSMQNTMTKTFNQYRMENISKLGEACYNIMLPRYLVWGKNQNSKEGNDAWKLITRTNFYKLLQEKRGQNSTSQYIHITNQQHTVKLYKSGVWRKCKIEGLNHFKVIKLTKT